MVAKTARACGMNTTSHSPNPGPTPDGALPRSSQLVLSAVAVLALGLLAYRGYGNGLGVRPTDHLPGAARHRVDLNAADRAELLQVPGIGPSLADAILTHRRDRGSFAAVYDLHGVKGVGGKTLDKLRPWLTVEESTTPEPTVEWLERKPPPDPPSPPAGPAAKLRPGDPTVDVNAADEATLQRLPGVGPTLARRIVDARGLDRFKSPDDLRRVKGIGTKTLEAVRPYVVCR